MSEKSKQNVMGNKGLWCNPLCLCVLLNGTSQHSVWEQSSSPSSDLKLEMDAVETSRPEQTARDESDAQIGLTEILMGLCAHSWVI